jgi:sarcosine oxidase
VGSYDVGIAGLGAMGSMTALELSRRGMRVIGWDRFRPPHALGSSTGKSRIIREAYFEHPQYVPLVQRAYRKWAELEREAECSLLTATGGLMIGPPDGTLLQGARQSAELHGLEYEDLSALEIRRRFAGAFEPGPGEAGLYESRAGVLRPEAAIAAALDLAKRAGAELRFDEPVAEWTGGESITVRTGAGRTYQVERLILAAGAWMAGTLPGAPLPLSVARQPLFWFAPLEGFGEPAARLPVFLWEWAPERMFYGFPDQGDGVKIAIHHQGEPADPDGVRRPVDDHELARLRTILASRTPGLNGRLLETAICLYTNTPDGDFLIDRSPSDPRVILASPCSGHGFKFAPALGEVLADLATDRTPAFDLTPFRVTR